MEAYEKNKKEECEHIVSRASDKKVSKPYIIEYRYWKEWRIWDNGEIKFKEEPHWSEWSPWGKYKTEQDRDIALNNLINKSNREVNRANKKEYRPVNLISSIDTGATL